MAGIDDSTREGPGTITLLAKSHRYFFGPNGFGVQRGRARKRLGWKDIMLLRRVVGKKVGNVRLEFVAHHTPPRWLPLFVIEHVPLHWLTIILPLDPRACGKSDADVIAITRRFAPDIRVDTIYRGRTISGNPDGPDIEAQGNSHGGADSAAGGSD
jgi:hypothetical protein